MRQHDIRIGGVSANVEVLPSTTPSLKSKPIYTHARHTLHTHPLLFFFFFFFFVFFFFFWRRIGAVLFSEADAALVQRIARSPTAWGRNRSGLASPCTLR
eukprot:NODE_6267_length_462_cov_71.140436_g4752_i0.p2 GENE.NODE_6267_length_462_cov_71.140436_g4752_i0~~NODE_6267_length_462_cov_71.140436_g4752_i0.p2  ORF type:complete len:100 (+),score=36.74 NODE_6267_length_462_cov_71.140436_g4752_i0:159-458(+)